MRDDARARQAFSLPRFCRLLAIAPAMMVAAGCTSGLMGSSPRGDPAEVEELKVRIVELQQRATVAELEGGRLRREIARLEAELAEARRLRMPTAPEARREPEANEAEPVAPSAIGLDQEVEETDLEPAPAVFAEPAAAAAEAAAREPEAMTEPAMAMPSAEAQALYDEGYALFHQQRYGDAEARFERYVELHPFTDLVDNALFWIGECRYARGDFSSALEAFTGTVERYPDGNKVADALLKAGKCLESLGDMEQARRTYEEVVDRYPGSAAAAQAGGRLDELR